MQQADQGPHPPMLNDKHLPKGTKKLKKRLNKELRQTELPGVTPELKEALKKFRADGMKAERDWLKPLPLKQTTLDKSFYTRSKASKDPKQVCKETEEP